MRINRRIIVSLILAFLFGKSFGTRSERPKKVDSLLANETVGQGSSKKAQSLLITEENEEKEMEKAKSLDSLRRNGKGLSLEQNGTEKRREMLERRRGMAPSLLNSQKEKQNLAIPSLLDTEEKKNGMTSSLLGTKEKKRMAQSLLDTGEKKEMSSSLLDKGKKKGSLLDIEEKKVMAPSLLDTEEKKEMSSSLLNKGKKKGSLLDIEEKKEMAPSLLDTEEEKGIPFNTLRIVKKKGMAPSLLGTEKKKGMAKSLLNPPEGTMGFIDKSGEGKVGKLASSLLEANPQDDKMTKKQPVRSLLVSDQATNRGNGTIQHAKSLLASSTHAAAGDGCTTEELSIEKNRLKYWKGEWGAFKYSNIACYLRREKGNLKFFVTGDIGGYEHANKLIPTPGQLSLAFVMRKYAKGQFRHIEDQEGVRHHNMPFYPHFVLNLGDNFYENGVCESDREAKFKDIFLNVYIISEGGRKNNPLAVNWYTVAGNNDYKLPEEEREKICDTYAEGEERNGELFGAAKKRAKAQIGHHFKGDDERLWNFPAEQYIIHQHFTDKHGHPVYVLIVQTDMVLICGASRKDFGAKRSKCKEKNTESEKHLTWLKEILELANEIWKPDHIFVAGHYPLYVTEGERSFNCAKKLQLIFAYYNVVYLAGHEHNLKYVEKIVDGKIIVWDAGSSRMEEKTIDSKLVHQIVSGAGSRMENCLEKKHVSNMFQHVKICYPRGIKREPKDAEMHGEEKEEKAQRQVNKEGLKESGKGIVNNVEVDHGWKQVKDKMKEKGIEREKGKDEERDADLTVYEGGAFVSVEISKKEAAFNFYAVGGKYYPRDNVEDENEKWKQIVKNGGRVDEAMMKDMAESLKIKMVGPPVVVPNRRHDF